MKAGLHDKQADMRQRMKVLRSRRPFNLKVYQHRYYLSVTKRKRKARKKSAIQQEKLYRFMSAAEIEA